MKKFSFALLICLAIGIAVSFAFVSQKPLYVDENTHFYTISNFCKFNFTYPDFLTTIPGYHFFGGIFGWLTSCTEIWSRAFNLIISIIAIGVFFLISRELKAKQVKEKTLLFVLLPILFPFFFLIYTDVLSLLFVLLMFYFSVKENYSLAGIFGLLSFVVRQNNIIWVIFAASYILFKKGFRIEISSDTFKKMAPYILILVIAGAFFIRNGGFSLGDRAQHPTFYLGLMNIYTALFFFFWLNLPEIILNLKMAASRMKNFDKRTLIAILLVTILLFILFLMTFKIDHPYNNYQIYSYFLRNKLLHLFDSSIFLKVVFFATAAISVLSIWVTKFKEKRQYIIYLFSFIFLAMSWLIENRYFIIPFVLFNLFAIREKKTEKFLILWYLLATISYMYLFLSGWTFW